MLALIGWILVGIIAWCVFWWIFAYYHVFSGCKTDQDRHMAFDGMAGHIIFYAPILYPAMIVMYPLDYLKDRLRERHEKLLEKARQWLMEELKTGGIETKKWEGIYFFDAQVAPDQEELYRNIYSKALKQFPELTPSEICKFATPLHPLDKAWAEKNNITEYAAPTSTLPCMDCGKIEQLGYRWGNEQMHARREGQYWRIRLLNKDENTERIIKRRYICHECRSKYYEFSISYYGGAAGQD